MMYAYQAFNQLRERMLTEFPDFQLKNKRGWFWRVIGRVIPSSVDYWMTIGRTIYVPDLDIVIAQPVWADYEVLWHERQHMVDLAALQKRLGGPLGAFLWAVGYASPQILALGALGAFWTPYAWLCLFALGPWPAPFRVWAEKRAYRASMQAWMAIHEQGSPPNRNYVHRLVRRFQGWEYYLMYWGSPHELGEWFHEQAFEMADELYNYGHRLLPHQTYTRGDIV